MKILRLSRIGENGDSTFGVLSVISKGNIVMPICNIIENGWKDNKQDISCIPKGTYELVKCTTTKTIEGKYTYIVMGVPRRTDIKLHIGNTYLDTQGCPLTVSAFGRINVASVSIMGGSGSRTAFQQFISAMIGSMGVIEDSAVLTIE